MERIVGYYWVRYSDKWIISYYDEWQYWHPCEPYKNDVHTGIVWDEIDERQIIRKQPTQVFVDKDMGHGKCKEKHCNKWAVTDYNGHGHWVCQSCDDSLQSYFEEEYR